MGGRFSRSVAQKVVRDYLTESYHDQGGHTPTAKKHSRSEWIPLVLARGESAMGRFLILRFLGGPIRQSEAAFIVSRKIGKAVVRNKVKRRLRACFRNRKRSNMAPGYYLFTARTICSEATFEQLKDEMDDLVGRAVQMTATMPEEGGRAPSKHLEK